MKKKKIYEGRILGLSLYDLIIQGRRVKREVIEHRGAAAILAFDEKGKIILVKQHRFPHGYVLEIPAGTLEKGEKPLKCAFREIQEETGYKATKMTHLLTYYPSVGYNREAIHCFVAKNLKKTSGLMLDEDEIISVVKMDIKKLISMIKTGKIIDSKTICAVLTYAAKNKLY
ncbi:MAG: NUDIX hydrolase [Nitrososphaeria archaeon]|nr:NUDIX hydrolase [Nitrososphaeria archaeon]NDB46495.1 NUDIX hydrolase [Nitrososphaeria archaeon]NDF35677.1 NUDIX hydrolase [Nitrosopumilaceae archaeon]